MDTARVTLRQVIVASAAAAAIVLLSACGGSSGPQVASLGGGSAAAGSTASPSSSVDRETAARQFSSCMRSHGVPTFPDPTVDSNGTVQMGLGPNSGFDRSDPNIRKGFEACQQFAQALRPNFTPEQQQQLQDALLKYAQCMRTNGYQMADPDFSTAGGMGGMRALGDINRQDPAFQKADAICRPETLGKLGFGGRGGGGFGGNGGGTAPPAPSTSGSST